MKKIIARAFNKASITYDRSALLHREVSQQLLSRLQYMNIKPQVIIDLGSNTGATTQLLKQCFPHSNVHAVDLSLQMLHHARQKAGKLARWRKRYHYVAADADFLPFPAHSVDLIFSSLMLQWSPDLFNTFKELQRVLTPHGALLFATYGPDTFKELRASWAGLDRYTHVADFIDMHDVGDLLIKAQFAEPVMDMEVFSLQYDAPHDLFQELKGVGARNLTANRQLTLTGKHKYQQMLKNYQQFYTSTGKIPVTYEIIYGLAWGITHTAQSRDPRTGEVKISLKNIGRAADRQL